MADMLVKLYTLPEIAPLVAQLKAEGIEVRYAAPSEKRIVTDWVRVQFSETWAAECEAAIEQRPVCCYIAVEKSRTHEKNINPYSLPPEKLVGFACFDATARGMFGPMGVQEDYRGRDIGKALLLMCLHAMAAQGYAYAVIGWAGPTEFYAKAVGATIIEGSEPGIYRGPLVGTSE
jgi:ribosomal protein S18 acetylase RimI-like enzyme